MTTEAMEDARVTFDIALAAYVRTPNTENLAAFEAARRALHEAHDEVYARALERVAKGKRT